MIRQLLALACLITFVACATSPEPNYYDLTPVRGATAPDVSSIIKIRRPAIAAFLDRPDIVRQKNDYQVLIDEENRWAEPPDAMIERILTEDIRERFPNATVFSETDDQSHDARFIIETNVDQFNEVDGRGTVMKGTLTIKDKTGQIPFKSQNFTFDGEDATSLTALASSLSALVGHLADMAYAEVEAGLETERQKPYR